MKKSFHVVSLSALLSTFAVSTAWAAERALEPDGNGGYYINMPATGTDVLEVPDNVTSFKVYDDGGAEGGYTPNSEGFLVLTAPEGRVLRLGGSIGAVNSYLYVYDAADETNYLFNKSGFVNIPRTLSSGRNLLLDFFTGSVVTDGLYLEVTVVDPAGPHMVVINETENGAISATPIEANAGETISLTISPAEGYYLARLEVTDEYNNSLSYDDYGNPVNGFVGGKWFSGNEASFTMAGTDAIVWSTFYRIDKYLKISESEMPESGTLPVIIPNGVSTFLIQPKYYGTEDNLIVLTAPEGKVLQIMSEDMTNSGNDSLYVYDGVDANATLLKKDLAREVGRQISSQNVMTLHYKGDGKYRPRDAFRVTVLDPSELNNVTVTNGTGGTVSPSVSSATVNTSVTLTASPDNGYMLDYVEVIDAEGLKVDVINGTWYESGEMSFKMPGSAAEIKPVFVRVEDGPSINMLKNGTFALAIPEGINTIKVYDNGGETGKYSQNCDGYLLLTAPSGKMLRLSGTVKVRYSNYASFVSGHLSAYDGIDANADQLFDAHSYGTWNVPRKLSTGENVMLYFHSASGDTYDGVDLTVTVVDPDAPHAINIVSVDDGSFVNPPTEASPGTVVTLTASPNSNYFFSAAAIQDEYATDSYKGNVDYVGGWYTNNTITFTMPRTEVTIKPSFDYFTYAQFVVEKTGTEAVSIPDEIKSFELKVDYLDEAIESVVSLTAPEGMLLQIQGNLVSRTGLDSLYVYDGVDANATELLKTAAWAYVNQVSSGCNLTLHYKELGQDRGMGSSLRVNVIDPNAEFAVSIDGNIYDGSVGADKAVAKFNSPVTVSATPAENYFLNRIEVQGANSGNPVAITGGTWYSGNEATFAMPSEDVVVSASFVSGLSAGNGLGMSMPLYDVRRVSIPAGVESFGLDDNGLGENELSKPLIITAPEGYLLQIDYANDDFGYGFNVYEGDIADPVAANAEQKSGTVVGRTLTVVCVGSGEMMYSTIVNLIPNEEHNIVVAPSVGDGGVTISPVSGRAYAGDTITVTGAANDGYVFNGIGVYDGDENFLFEVVDGAWYNGEVKFVMPLSNVLVEPIFADYDADYVVKIPKSDTLRVSVPEGVKWIEVYDDGGPGGNYSNGNNGVLVLTVPEGYSLVTDGEINLNDENDSLYIYDGTGENAKILTKVSGYLESYYDIERYSTGRSFTYRFKSNGEGNASGIEMYATVMKTSSFGAVAVHEVNGWTAARVNGNYVGNETVNIPSSISVGEIIYEREFTPGVPSTITLPFTLPERTTINADFYTLTSVVPDGRKWRATMTYIGDGNLPQANTPYAIIPENDYLNFSFSGTATLQTSVKDTTKVSDGDWFFVGTYSYKKWTSNDDELGLAYAFAATDNVGGAKKGKFGKIYAGASANPLRAYLRKKDETVQLPPQQNSPAAPGAYYSVSFVPEGAIEVDFVKASVDGSDEGTTVAKGLWNMRTGEFKMLRTYDAKGRKLNGTPKARGSYYGKKVLKK